MTSVTSVTRLSPSKTKASSANLKPLQKSSQCTGRASQVIFWPLLTISDNFWPLLTIADHFWPFLIISDHFWPLRHQLDPQEPQQQVKKWNLDVSVLWGGTRKGEQMSSHNYGNSSFLCGWGSTWGPNCVNFWPLVFSADPALEWISLGSFLGLERSMAWMATVLQCWQL